jgi:hypothetical protein
MIPKGLPGEGNILVLDNGGFAGYGDSKIRAYSRVLEFNPVTMEIVWEYSDRTGLDIPLYGENQRFFTPFIGSAQRLPNGNTLITDGVTGAIIEVTKDKIHAAGLRPCPSGHCSLRLQRRVCWER